MMLPAGFLATAIASPTVQATTATVLSKLPGVVARYQDKETGQARSTILKREFGLISIVAVATAALQVLFTAAIQPKLQKSKAFGKYEMLVRAVLALPSLFFAEKASRWLAYRRKKLEAARNDEKSGKPEAEKAFGPDKQEAFGTETKGGSAVKVSAAPSFSQASGIVNATFRANNGPDFDKTGYHEGQPQLAKKAGQRISCLI